MLRVKDGKARLVNDRLLPPRRDRAAAVPRGAAIARPARRARAAALTPRSARATTPRWPTRAAFATG